MNMKKRKLFLNCPLKIPFFRIRESRRWDIVFGNKLFMYNKLNEYYVNSTMIDLVFFLNGFM